MDKKYLLYPDEYLKMEKKRKKKSKKNVKRKTVEELAPFYFKKFRINSNYLILNYDSGNILTVS